MSRYLVVLVLLISPLEVLFSKEEPSFKDSPVMTCEPIEIRIKNVSKEMQDLYKSASELNLGLPSNLRCETKDSICYVLGQSISCVRK